MLEGIYPRRLIGRFPNADGAGTLKFGLFSIIPGVLANLLTFKRFDNYAVLVGRLCRPVGKQLLLLSQLTMEFAYRIFPAWGSLRK